MYVAVHSKPNSRSYEIMMRKCGNLNRQNTENSGKFTRQDSDTFPVAANRPQLKLRATELSPRWPFCRLSRAAVTSLNFQTLH